MAPVKGFHARKSHPQMRTDYIQEFEQRLLGLFERKAEEFTRYAEEQPNTAIVTTQLAGLYKDLAEAMRK